MLWLYRPFCSDQEDGPELPPPPGITDNRQCLLCHKYGDENTDVSLKSFQTFVHVKTFLPLMTRFVPGGGQAVVHRAERVDPHKLRSVVIRGLWRRRGVIEKRSHGCPQGETAGKTRCPSPLRSFFFQAVFARLTFTACCCFSFSTVRSASCQGPQSAAVSHHAPVTTTSCALVIVTVSSWKTRKSIVQNTETSSRGRWAVVRWCVLTGAKLNLCSF